ncbi:hypothetical protein [Enterococcus faecium]|uniref:Uncharacterized protein n=1 Tax=Enterococcus faecium TaxID=1352 RepID=A0A242B061_ENTFC|nr:hypothetical protein [Enterococcus faecium]OTN86627.1 hypothetical protein A5810_003025 [Enterococcus faecium]
MNQYTTTEWFRLLDLKAAIEELNEKIIDLSYFRFRIPYIEQAVQAGRYQEKENWQEIARLLEVRKGYEHELAELEFSRKKGSLESIHFYRFLTPIPAILAVKEGCDKRKLYGECVTTLDNEKPLIEEVSLATVTWEMSRQPTEEHAYLSLEEIEMELEEIGRYATCSTYCGSVISIAGVIV